MPLRGKYALVTGGSRGIGRGIALKLATEGVKVGLHYYQNEKAAKDTLSAVRRSGSDGIILQADVTKTDQVRLLSSLLHLSPSPWTSGTRRFTLRLLPS